MRRVWWHIPAHPSADPPRSEGPVRVGPFLTHCGLRVEIASLARGRSSYPKSWSGPICLDRAGPVGYRARHRRVFPEASLIVSPPGYKKRAQRRFLRRHLDPLMLRGCLKSGWSAEKTSIIGHPGRLAASHSQMASVSARTIACRSSIFFRISATCLTTILRILALAGSPSTLANSSNPRTSSTVKPSCRARRTNFNRATSRFPSFQTRP